jgi:hypothetical protein
MFAPKPLAMSAANDWTKEMMTKGYPELQKLYKVFGAEDKVLTKAWLEFGHNYNQVAREMMYTWFQQHLIGGPDAGKPIVERPFKPIPPKDLSVYDEQHPRPKDDLNARDLRALLTTAANKQYTALVEDRTAYRNTNLTALRAMIGEDLQTTGKLELRKGPTQVKLDGGYTMHLAAFGRANGGDVVPMAGVFNESFRDKVVVWVHPQGKSSLIRDGKLVPQAKALVEKGFAVVAPDVFRVGESASDKPFAVNAGFSGYTFGYNRPVFAMRVHDIHTTLMFARDVLKGKTIHLVGWEGAGPWVAAARAGSGTLVNRTAIDLDQFQFENITKSSDENMLPGAVRLGGMPAILALCAPGELLVHNVKSSTIPGDPISVQYGKKIPLDAKQKTPDDIVQWLIAK